MPHTTGLYTKPRPLDLTDIRKFSKTVVERNIQYILAEKMRREQPSTTGQKPAAAGLLCSSQERPHPARKGLQEDLRQREDLLHSPHLSAAAILHAQGMLWRTTTLTEEAGRGQDQSPLMAGGKYL